MKITDLVELSWPFEGKAEITDCPAGRLSEVKAFIAKYENEDTVSLAALIDFADRDDTPSIQLKLDACLALTSVVGHGCRWTTKDLLRSKLALPLSLVPRYHWAERLEFVHGPLTVQYTASQDWTAEMGRVRKDILK